MKPYWIDDLWAQGGMQIASLDVKLFDLHTFFNKQTEKLEDFGVDPNPNIFFLGLAYCRSACKFWLLYFYGVETQVFDLLLTWQEGVARWGLVSSHGQQGTWGSGYCRGGLDWALWGVSTQEGLSGSWNEMPGEVVKSASLKVFKKWLDMALSWHGGVQSKAGLDYVRIFSSLSDSVKWGTVGDGTWIIHGSFSFFLPSLKLTLVSGKKQEVISSSPVCMLLKIWNYYFF